MRRRRAKIEVMTNSVTRSRMNSCRSSSMRDFAGHVPSARTTVACSSHPAVAGFTSKSTTLRKRRSLAARLRCSVGGAGSFPWARSFRRSLSAIPRPLTSSGRPSPDSRSTPVSKYGAQDRRPRARRMAGPFHALRPIPSPSGLDRVSPGAMRNRADRKRLPCFTSRLGGCPRGHPVESARHTTAFAQGHREAGLKGEVLDGTPACLVEPAAVAVGIEHADLP